MNREPPGILEVLTGNKRILFGVVVLLLGLVLAFSAVYNRTARYSRTGTIGLGEAVGIEKRRSANEGKLILDPETSAVSKPGVVALLNDDRELMRKVSLNSLEENVVEIRGGESYFELASGETSYNYEYRVKFSYQPFRWLSIPAALFTVLGVVAIYRGFDEFMADFARKRVEESEVGEEETKGEGQHVDFMGIDNEKGEDR